MSSCIPSSRQSLQHIVAIAHAISPAVVRSNRVIAPLDFSSGFALPPPPSIHDILSCLNLKPSLAAQLVAVYEEFASQFREVSQTKVRHVIYACRQVPAGPGVPIFNSHRLCITATEVYMRTLWDMIKTVVAFFEKYSHGMGISSPFDRSPGRVFARRCPGEQAQVSLQGRESAVCERPRTSMMSTAIACKPISTEACVAIPQPRQGLARQVTKSFSSVDKPSDAFTHGLLNTSRCYPVQYGRSHAPPRDTFSSSSLDFFGARRTQASPQIPSIKTTESLSTILSGKLQDMHLIKSRRGAEGHKSDYLERREHVISPSCFRASKQDVTSTLFFETPDRSQSAPDQPSAETKSRISLNVCNTSNAPEVAKRRLAPMPRRTSPGVLTSDSQSQISPTSKWHNPPERPFATLETPAPYTSRISFTSPLPPSVPSMSTSQPRQRKVAPLPHRRPIATPPRHVYTSPLSHSFTSTQKISFTMSRTPSLASLSSSRSASPSTSDELDTPPLSPATSPVDLKAQDFDFITTVGVDRPPFDPPRNEPRPIDRDI